jgi:hypothetical protein
MKKVLLTKIFPIFFGLFLMFGLFISAQAVQTYSFTADSGVGLTGKQAGYDISATPSPELIAGRIVQIVLSLLGVAFLGFMIYAGIMWMTAQGNEQKVEKAKSMITESIVGLIIVIAAYAIAYFVINWFGALAGQ